MTGTAPRFLRGARALGAAALLAVPGLALSQPAHAQSVLGQSPNLRAEWELQRWQTYFVFGHRFELISGGDQIVNLPTLTLGMGLPGRFAAGLDFTSNSEIVPANLGGNETQFWLSRGLLRARAMRLDGIAAYNTAARSADGALTARARMGPLTLLAEGRAYSDALGTGSGGAAIAGGSVLHLTRYLELSADIGRMLEPDTLRRVWSAGIAMAIPGTPHTFLLEATNVGALTLQGASRPKIIGPQGVRYGFVFTAPLGSRAQWARIFRRTAPPEPETLAEAAAASVEMRMLAFTPREVRIRAGERVVWVNRDPLQHTVTADDGSWGSALLDDGERYSRVFERPGRYTYHCEPHPEMRGVVIVDER